VQRGDSLYDIASTASQGQDAVSLDQMLLAMYRNNPNAFIGGNINRLRTGSVLKVPSQADAQKVSPREARREVVAQTSGFAGYRNRLATAAEANAATDTDSARQQSGSVSARVQDQATPAASGRDELRLSKADRTGKANAAARDEELVAKERALKDMESRVAQLEKNLSDMQRLVELKNAELAKAASAAKPAAGAAPATAAPAVAAANAPAPAAAAASSTPAAAQQAAQAVATAPANCTCSTCCVGNCRSSVCTGGYCLGAAGGGQRTGCGSVGTCCCAEEGTGRRGSAAADRRGVVLLIAAGQPDGAGPGWCRGRAAGWIGGVSSPSAEA